MPNRIITLQQLKQCMEALKEIYDTVRIVHPLKKRLYSIDGGNLVQTELHCFGIWEKKEICTNCISIRALQKKEVYFKLELDRDRIVMIMAVPVQDDEELLVLELIKDITHTMLVDNLVTGKENPLFEMLKDMGQLQIRDALTGLFNRRFIDERLPVDLLSTRLAQKPLSVILADIDRFKQVNDKYGHVAGDHVLMEFARLLNCTNENTGWVARYGGEEFLIGLPDIGMQNAAALAEKIRSAVETSEFLYDNSVIRITSSFGVCTLLPPKEVSPEELVNYADKNLYTAKNSGRNRVIASELF